MTASDKIWISLLCLCMMGCSVEEQPETIVRHYIQSLSNGDWEEAMQYCTPARQAYLTALGGIMESADSISAPDSTAVLILEIECTRTDTLTICETLERDAFEEYRAQYTLVRRNESWLIDQPKIPGAVESHEEVLEDN